MLDFSFITDGQSMRTRGLNRAGGIEWKEFEVAQNLQLIEKHCDYYGDFRWSSQQVRQKQATLTPAIEAAVPHLAAILKQAFVAECGLAAFGD
jgi:hypothetical protein